MTTHVHDRRRLKGVGLTKRIGGGREGMGDGRESDIPSVQVSDPERDLTCRCWL